jgi:hypothetical protein
MSPNRAVFPLIRSDLHAQCLRECAVWTVIGENVAGTSHVARNLPCQDALRYSAFGANEEWLAVVVADGAGSSSHSEIGAAFVCDQLLDQARKIDLESLFTREGMSELFSRVQSQLFSEAERLSLRPRDLACTALMAIVGPDSAVFAQLGDGAIVVGDGVGFRTVFWPEPAEYANCTDFLTDEHFAEKLLFEVSHDSISQLAVLTDGLQRLALDFTTRSPHAPFFRPLFRELQSAAVPEPLFEPFRAFLSSERVNSKTDDDKTLVLAVRRS